jgi:hypothetical protein
MVYALLSGRDLLLPPPSRDFLPPSPGRDLHRACCCHRAGMFTGPAVVVGQGRLATVIEQGPPLNIDVLLLSLGRDLLPPSKTAATFIKYNHCVTSPLLKIMVSPKQDYYGVLLLK